MGLHILQIKVCVSAVGREKLCISLPGTPEFASTHRRYINFS